MPGNPREIITMAERRFPVRIRIAVPPYGLDRRHAQITAWLDENCGSDGWAMTPAGMRGVLNDAISLYFADATLASAFVARWDLTPHSVRCSPPRPAALKVREWISSALASILRTWNRPPVVSTLDPAHPVRRNFRNRTVF